MVWQKQLVETATASVAPTPREHGADAAAETRLSCEQNSYFSGYWEPQRSSDGTVGAALNRPDSRIAPVSAETGGGDVDQHEERRAREG